MSETQVLVTGSTGATGGGAVRYLIEKGFSVRALAHKIDERSNKLQDLGAEIVVGDMLDFDFIRSAMRDINRAYFVFPVRPGLIQATAYFSQAASENRLEAIVNMSQISARSSAKSHAAQDHWVAERVFNEGGVPVTHLRPTFFAEWFLYFSYMLEAGVVRFPFGTGKHAPIAAKDQARVIAAILADPAPHAGRTYSLFGPTEMTYKTMTAVIGRALERHIQYEQVDFDEFVEDARRNGRDFNEFFVQHVREVVKDHQNGIFAGTNDSVRQIGGFAPMTIEAFALEHADAFGGLSEQRIVA